MLCSVPSELLDIIVKQRLDVRDRCSLSATCRGMHQEATGWFRDEFFDLTDQAKSGWWKMPTIPWLRRHGCRVSVDLSSASFFIIGHGSLASLHGVRIESVECGFRIFQATPLFSLAPFSATLKSLKFNGVVQGSAYDHLADLTGLETLVMHNCPSMAGDIAHLGSLSHLRHLDMSRVFLGPALFPELSKLTALTHLSITDVMTEEEAVPNISLIFPMTQLKSLELGGFSMPQIPDFGPLAQTLTHLSLHNDETPLDADETLSNISALTNLVSLSFKAFDLTFIPPEWNGLTRLTSIDFSYNYLGEMDNWEPVIPHFPQVRELNLSQNVLSGIPPTLSRLTSLVSLDMMHMPTFPITGGWEHVPASVSSIRAISHPSMPPHILSKLIS